MNLTSNNNQPVKPAIFSSGEIKIHILLAYIFFMFIYVLLTFSVIMLLLSKLKASYIDIWDLWLCVVVLFGFYLIVCLSRLPFKVYVNNGNIVTYSIRGRRKLNLLEAKSVSLRTTIYATALLKKSNLTVLKIVDGAGKAVFINTYTLLSVNKAQLCIEIVGPLRKAGITNLTDDGVDIWIASEG